MARYKLHATCYECYMLQAACYKLHVARYVPPATSYMLHVARYKATVSEASIRPPHAPDP